MIILARVVGWARAGPFWAWIIAIALAWGGWQKHLASSRAQALLTQQQTIAHAKERALADKLAESSRRVEQQTKVIQNAEKAKARAISDAASATAASAGLRDELRAYTAGGRGADSAASAASKTDRLADLLGTCAERYSAVAQAADRAVIAGEACEESYLGLTKPTTKN